MENRLYYYDEAKVFEEALPIGNGRMGAMVYGGVKTEKLSLNEDTLWTGTGKRNPVPENAFEAYKKAQKLVLEDKLSEAHEEIAKNFHSMWSQVYMPLGNLYIDFPHDSASDYIRTLDFTKGIATVSYKADGVSYKREVFASNPDDVIAIKLSSDKDGALSFCVSCDTGLKVTERRIEYKKYITNGVCPSIGCLYPCVQKEPLLYTDESGIAFTYAVKVDCDGVVADGDDCIKVENATEAVLYISVKTNFNAYELIPDTSIEQEKNALEILSGLDIDKYNTVKATHTEDFSFLYDRVKLDLNAPKEEGDIKERLERFDGSDIGLYELLFGYGRYLTISSSRPGTQVTNLQGIWNEKLTPPWSSNCTININTEMNYWPVFNTNLAECFLPFLNLARKLQKTGKLTARDYYGARGFVSHHNTDLWGMSNPTGLNRDYQSCVFAFWNMSSGWICSQLYDLYEYTLDKTMLEEIFPIMEDATLFYTDIMYKDEKGYMICPSTSPENWYTRGEEEHFSISKTTAMTASILKELFVRYLKAAEILGVENDITNKVSEILPELYTVEITSDGRIKEWAYEEKETEVNHRHVSHLFSLYPGNQITVKDTPELAEACKKSLLVRGDDGTGWSLGWKVNLWAYLKDGNHALKLLKRQLKLVEPSDEILYMGGGGTYPNMFDAHPPFQIDGNFGSTAAICNMLMQSEVGHIELLPALPDEWKDGSVSGLVAKGNIEIDMEWKDKKVTSVTLKSAEKKTVCVYVNGKCEKIEIEKGKAYKMKVIN